MMMQARIMRVKLAERCTVMVEVPSPNQCAPIIGRRRRLGIVRWRSLGSRLEGRLSGAGGWWRWLRLIAAIAVGTGHVKDDLCLAIFFGHGREGTEDETVDVGDYGGAARGDAAFGEEIVESAESFVDGFGGLEVFGLAHERGEQGEVVL